MWGMSVGVPLNCATSKINVNDINEQNNKWKLHVHISKTLLNIDVSCIQALQGIPQYIYIYIYIYVATCMYTTHITLKNSCTQVGHR